MWGGLVRDVFVVRGVGVGYLVGLFPVGGNPRGGCRPRRGRRGLVVSFVGGVWVASWG